MNPHEQSTVRSLLWLLIVLFVVAAVAMFAVSAFIDDFVQTLLTSLASACISVAIALAITEVVLKPTFARELLALSRLSQRVDDIGLVQLGEDDRVNWRDLYAHGGTLLISVTHPQYWWDRDGTRLLAAAERAGGLHVNVCLPKPGVVSDIIASSFGKDPETYKLEVESVAAQLEAAWKGRAAISGASHLRIDWLNAPNRGHFMRSDHYYVADVWPGAYAPGSRPLYVVIDRRKNSDVGDQMAATAASIEAVRGDIPVWETPPRKAST